jgi:hypothetical protein
MAYAPVAPVAPRAVPQPIEYLGEAYSKTTLPDATKYANRIVVCTNGGAADAPCLAISDGIGWFVIAVGAAVA